MKHKNLILIVVATLVFSLAAAPVAFAGGGSPVVYAPTNAAYYTVQYGDTLLEIARHFGVDLFTLAGVNGITNVNQIESGTVLNIGAARVTDAGAWFPVYNAPANAAYYTVQSGDNLFRIARHFGVDLFTLASVNGIANINVIHRGQVINVAAARNPTPISFPVYGAPVNADYYTVQSGDNLFRIAQHFGVDLGVLAAVNGIANPRVIHRGQVINIAAARGYAANPTPPTASYDVHVVSRGETLNSIAAWYGVTLNSLISANGLADPNRIEVGQIIYVPRWV